MERSEIHNYYEHLVFEYIDLHVVPSKAEQPDDYFLDIACVALNKLPTRYVRHEIDMAFYLHRNERLNMIEDVKRAVDEAVEYIDEHFMKRQQESD